jgi:hypothetical protein
LMGFPLPLPVGCRECGKREVASARCRGAASFGDAVMSRIIPAFAFRGTGSAVVQRTIRL